MSNAERKSPSVKGEIDLTGKLQEAHRCRCVLRGMSCDYERFVRYQMLQESGWHAKFVETGWTAEVYALMHIRVPLLPGTG